MNHHPCDLAIRTDRLVWDESKLMSAYCFDTCLSSGRASGLYISNSLNRFSLKMSAIQRLLLANPSKSKRGRWPTVVSDELRMCSAFSTVIL